MKTLSFLFVYLLISTATAHNFEGSVDSINVIDKTSTYKSVIEIGRFSDSKQLPPSCPFARYARHCLASLTNGSFEPMMGYPVNYGENITILFDRKSLDQGLFARVNRQKLFEFTDCNGAMDQNKRYFSSLNQNITVDISQYDGVCLRNNNVVVTLTDSRSL
ncbi:MAG: hypothetical protein K2Q26_09295 [Bdellovibrionales bacterium]|nr:hypothetical protein [Bdellovibrionales bacterium]